MNINTISTQGSHPLFTIAVVLAVSITTPLLGAINTTGNVTPDPNTVGSGDTLYVGLNSDGAMELDGGSTVDTSISQLGFASNVAGVVTIDGLGTRFRTFGSLIVGRDGEGFIDVQNGGAIEAGNLVLGDRASGAGVLTIANDTTQARVHNTLTVGNNGLGILLIHNEGGMAPVIVYIAEHINSSGELTVDGSDASMHTSPVYVGRRGNATLNITNGGYVNSSSVTLGWATTSTADAHIDGADSLLSSTSLNVGVEGSATLEVTGGATASTGFSAIGLAGTASGVVTIDGPQSTWFSHDIHVGVEGNGTLNIRNGALTQTGVVRVGSATTGVGQINFDGGTLIVSNLLKTSPQDLLGTGTINTEGIASDIDLLFNSTHGAQQQILLNSEPDQNVIINLDQGIGDPLGAGYRGNGSLTITDGVTITSGEGLFGDLIGSVGTANIDGAGTLWHNNDGIIVGNEGTGVLSIQGGATVTLDDDLIIANHATSNGTVNLIDGTLDLIRNDIKTGQGNGTFNFSGGMIKNVRAISMDMLQQGGVLSPGASVQGLGKSFISGDYIMTAGTLQMQIAGPGPHDYDRLEVSGITMLSGTLEVSLLDGFVPNLGDSFGFLIALGGYTGSFADLILPDLSEHGLDWRINPNGSTFFLDVIEAALQGDLDGDGFVGINDLNLVLSNWNQSVPPGDPLADPSGDGFVGIDDLNAVLGNWNAGTPPVADSNIPEPATLSLTLLGTVALLRTNRG